MLTGDALSVGKSLPRLHLPHGQPRSGRGVRPASPLDSVTASLSHFAWECQWRLSRSSLCEPLQPHFPPGPPVSSTFRPPDLRKCHTQTYPPHFLLTLFHFCLVHPVSPPPPIFLKSQGITLSVFLWSYCKCQSWLKAQF